MRARDRRARGRVQGTVVLEAVISTTGCIREIEVLRGIQGLDFAAVTAVSQWRYTTAQMNGKPVPVIMRVTVNFRLN